MAKTRSNGYMIGTVLIILAGAALVALSKFIDSIDWMRDLALPPKIIFWIGIIVLSIGLCMIPKFRHYVADSFKDPLLPDTRQ